jgi:hypothetical protein
MKDKKQGLLQIIDKVTDSIVDVIWAFDKDIIKPLQCAILGHIPHKVLFVGTFCKRCHQKLK